LAAGLLFIAPGAIAILILSVIYAQYQETLLITAVFFGLKPAVTAIVMEAVLRIGKRVLKNGSMVVLAVLSFIALAAFAVPFPVVVLVAGLIGFVGSRIRPEEFAVLKGHGSANATPPAPTPLAVAPERLWRRSLIVSAICLPLWFAPVIILAALLGPDSILVTEGVFFSKMAVVTFGGAYAVLAYVAQQGVEHFHWLEPGEMLDGLGMAETTPGPLIMVLQFVGFMAAYRNPGPFDPMIAGVLGSLMTTWVTFVPCFYWIFLGAPFVERLRGHRGLTGALSAITAAVVGVISNLWLWFLIHTLFAGVYPVTWGPLHVQIPVLSSLNLPAAVIAMLAMLLTFRWKLGMVWTLSISTLAGAAWMLAQKLL
ncbi:MAG: chromate transporter, partial [Planctomycetaceae bacterium]|nr:chromate transporter [Planctomycetaceae bacterium]